MSTEMKTQDFIKYLEETKSLSTLKIYRLGLNLFSEYYGKSLDQILEERKNDLASGDLLRRKRFLREIEKYHAWLMKEKNKPLNSATTYVNGILQLFRYFEMGVTVPSGSMVGKRKLSTKDFVPTVEQYRAMFRVADRLRDKILISLGKDLGARIGDFVKITKDMIPDLEQEAPIAFDLMTQKEDVLAKSFISEETVGLLKQYLPSLQQHNPYLFPTINGKKWSYKATLDYIKECEKGKWIIGFLDEEGNLYECPTTTNRELVEKVSKLSEQKLKVTVEVNEAPNEYGSEFPTLIDVEEI